jgi:predicted nuclease of restriction endonuclease-like (RecB) superfamily
MLRFGEVFAAEEIVSALSRQLSWTHLRSLIYIDDPLKREFYLEMCRSEGGSTRTLQGRLDSMLVERTALWRKPDELLTSELATLRDQRVLGPNLVLKYPYVLDFLGLRDRYLETDLEDARSKCIRSHVREGKLMRIGYARVSTQDQDNTAQIAALNAAGCGRIFEEKVSVTRPFGTIYSRPTRRRWTRPCAPLMNRASTR